MKVNLKPHKTWPGCYTLDYRPAGAKKERVREHVEGYKEALERKASIEGTPVLGREVLHPTIETVSNEYLQWVEANQAPDTYRDKVSAFRAHVIPHFGKYRARELNQTVYDSFQQRLKGKRRAIIMYQDFLSAMIRWMRDRNLAEGAIFRPTKPKYHAPKPIIPSMEDVQAVIDYVKDPNRKALLVTMLWTGLRWNEARLLRWEDVYLKKGFIRVRESDQEEEVHVPIYPEMRIWLEANKKKEGWVFPNPRVNLRTKQVEPWGSLQTILETACKKLGVDIGHHDFRRRSAQNVYEASGFDIFAAQRHLRHKDIRTTMRYLGVDDQRRAQVMDSLVAHVQKLRDDACPVDKSETP